MKRFLILGLLLAGCGTIDERNETWQEYYGAPAKESERKVVERKRIEYFSGDLKTVKRLGLLEKCQVRPGGARDWHDIYYIKNPTGTVTEGFVTEKGVFYRYDRLGKPERVGEYRIFDDGLKIFFGLPIKSNLVVSDIDPYKG